jgi:hypothetical protein
MIIIYKIVILEVIHYFKKYKMHFAFFKAYFFWIVCFLKHFNLRKNYFGCDYMKKGEYFQEMKILHTISLCSLQICFLHLVHTVYE